MSNIGPPFYFELTDDEADSLLNQFPRMEPNKDGLPTTFYTLLAQYLTNPFFITTEDNVTEILCENGTDLLVTEATFQGF